MISDLLFLPASAADIVTPSIVIFGKGDPSILVGSVLDNGLSQLTFGEIQFFVDVVCSGWLAALYIRMRWLPVT